jgi:pimeloyl-ACP methyl ester carboxylesterase
MKCTNRWYCSCIAIIILIFAFASIGIAAQQPITNLPNGQLLQTGITLPDVHSVAQPEQSYALYLPSNYSADHPWPIVYAFDPGARGINPVELMKVGAEKYGYIVVGSNNSRNGPWKPEAEAVKAVWEDTHGRFTIDDRRITFAGFSGGARVAARAALNCKCAQGLYLNGAGYPPETSPTRNERFDIFVTAGLDDFNYGELVNLDAQMDSLQFTHFLRRFDGPHSWAPSEVASEALAWFELQAMKENRRPRDAALIADELAAARERAQKLEQSGAAFFALQNYRQVAAEFDGLADVLELKLKADALAKLPAVKTGAAEEKEGIALQSSLQSSIVRAVESLRNPGSDPIEQRRDVEQQIKDLMQRAANEKRPVLHRGTERAQASVAAYFSETGESLRADRDFSRARIYFELGLIMRPESSRLHISLARCLVALRDTDGAARELKLARVNEMDAKALADLARQAPELAAILPKQNPEKPTQDF